MSDSNLNPNLTTLAQAITMRDQWFAAMTAISNAQEYTITNGPAMRKLVKADLKEVQEQYLFWEGRVRDLTPRSRRVRSAVPY